MALAKDHIITVTYSAGLGNLREIYEGVLSHEDLEILSSPNARSFTVANAYHRVEQMQVTKGRIDFALAIYNANVTKFVEIKRYNFVPDTSESASNYHTQCYEYAKSLDEYIDAVDC